MFLNFLFCNQIDFKRCFIFLFVPKYENRPDKHAALIFFQETKDLVLPLRQLKSENQIA
jgi:hypothetical protein